MHESGNATHRIRKAGDQGFSKSRELFIGLQCRVNDHRRKKAQSTEGGSQQQRRRFLESEIHQPITAKCADVPRQSKNARQERQPIRSGAGRQNDPQQHHVQHEAGDITQQIYKGRGSS